MKWGREDDEWAELLDATYRFLAERAKLGRTTDYSALNSALRRRTGHAMFDFALESDRAAMGDLLGEVATERFAEVGALISCIVLYLNENEPGSGFYRLAIAQDLLEPNPSADAKMVFWTEQLNKTYAHFQG